MDGLIDTFLKRTSKKHRTAGLTRGKNIISYRGKIPPMF